MKAKNFRSAITLDQIPNVGKGLTRELRQIGIIRPHHLRGQDPVAIYKKLLSVGMEPNLQTADILFAAVDFMNGGTPKSWEEFTEIRKKILK